MIYNIQTKTIKHHRRALWAVIFLTIWQIGSATESGKGRPVASCPMKKMEVTQLPNLNVPRVGHAVMSIGDEVVVFGGHTSGFVPTPTAEYFADGEWHLMQMVYTHDQGAAALTDSGNVVVFGGHEKELGIGQTFTLELYDPVEHRFTGYGCLEKKRCFSNTLSMGNGEFIISGNWYHEDCIELYDGSRQNKFVKPVSQQRSLPHILRTARDNAIIFAARDIHAEDFDTIIIDRLKGESFTVPLFETWRPYCYPIGYHGSCFIGDESKDEYINLMQVMRGDSSMALVRVEGETFSLLPTTSPIPMRSQWGAITWYCHLLADRKVGRAYIEGYGEEKGDHRIYVAAIDYLKSPATITLYYSDPQEEEVGRVQPVLTSSGDLMLVGGAVEHNNNFEASRSVFLLHVATEEEGTGTITGTITGTGTITITAILIAIVLCIVAALFLWRRKNGNRNGNANEPEDSANTVSDRDEELMEQLLRLMEEQKPYLNSDLRVEDVANMLDTNRTYLSNCIRNIRGCQFMQFVNAYRVEHAKQVLRQNGDIKMSYVWNASGFSSEPTFFRIFKEITGMTPKEWLQNNASDTID